MLAIFLRNRARFASFLISFFPPTRLHSTKSYILRKVGGINIGINCEIWNTVMFNGSPISVGDYCFLGDRCCISASKENGQVSIGNNCAIGKEVIIITGTHYLGPPSRRCGKGFFKPIHIGDGCRISTRAMLLEGVSVGSGSMIAAGAVVVRDVPDNVLVGGVPAKYIKQLPSDV